MVASIIDRVSLITYLIHIITLDPNKNHRPTALTLICRIIQFKHLSITLYTSMSRIFKLIYIKKVRGNRIFICFFLKEYPEESPTGRR